MPGEKRGDRSCAGSQSFLSAHAFPDGFGKNNRAIGLLAGFENGHEESGESGAGAVEGVYETGAGAARIGPDRAGGPRIDGGNADRTACSGPRGDHAAAGDPFSKAVSYLSSKGCDFLKRCRGHDFMKDYKH